MGAGTGDGAITLFELGRPETVLSRHGGSLKTGNLEEYSRGLGQLEGDRRTPYIPWGRRQFWQRVIWKREWGIVISPVRFPLRDFGCVIWQRFPLRA